MNSTLISTSAQKVLDFLIHNPGRQFLANEIVGRSRVSRAGVNFALRKLAKEKLIIREKKGKVYLYSVDHTNPVIKQLKVVRCVASLKPLVDRISGFSEKVVLFGSCARGENIPSSDIDLFILTNNREEVLKLIKKDTVNGKLQPVVRTPLKLAEMKSKEQVFYEEISRGITLWEARE